MDVAVVGGGLSGLSAALHLKRSNRRMRVALFEARSIGAGASGKSGGIIVQHPKLFGSVRDVSFLKEFVSDERITCGWQRPSGRLLCLDHEYPHDLLNPALLTDSLGELCQEAGVQLYEHSAVDRLSGETGTGYGAEFSVAAGVFIFATDSFPTCSELLNSAISRSVQPCLVVEVPEHRSQHIPWAFYKETDGAHFWGRRVGRRRFLFGGIEYSAGEGMEPSDRLLGLCATVIPVLSEVTPLAFWEGPIATFKASRLRHIIRISPNTFYIGGYNGDGIAAAVRSGSQWNSFLHHGWCDDDYPVQDLNALSS